jgi:hypothetical protein
MAREILEEILDSIQIVTEIKGNADEPGIYLAQTVRYWEVKPRFLTWGKCVFPAWRNLDEIT